MNLHIQTKNNIKNSLIVAFLTTLILGLLALLFTHPVWETNDDVVMSMIAHGYGLTEIASPQIVFSNILWGHIINMTPEINGVLGYDTVYYTTLVLSGFVILFSMLFLSDSIILSISLFVLLIIKPTISPQFTVLAGYAALAGFSCLMLFHLANFKKMLIASSLFFIVAYLIRAELFLLFTFASLPIVPWKKLIKFFPLSVASVTIMFMVFATFYNWNSYQQPKWEKFNHFQKVRPLYTDFGISKFAIQSPEILQKYNLSANDISLISNWFYGDSQLNDPIKLSHIAAEIKKNIPFIEKVKNALVGIGYFGHFEIRRILYLTLILFLLQRKNKRLWIAGALCVGSLAAIGWLGRPGVLRLYYPLCALLVLYSYLSIKIENPKKSMKIFILALISLVNAGLLFNLLNARKTLSVSNINWNFKTPLVVLGAGIPIEFLYHPFSTDKKLRSLRYFSSSWATLIPGSVSMKAIKQESNVADKLKLNEGVFIIENAKPISNLLNIYCKEHLQKPSMFSQAGNIGDLKILKWQCR